MALRTLCDGGVHVRDDDELGRGSRRPYIRGTMPSYTLSCLLSLPSSSLTRLALLSTEQAVQSVVTRSPYLCTLSYEGVISHYSPSTSCHHALSSFI